MIKNRITQIVFQTIYCVLAVIGFINSLGYFNANFNNDFYIYYTNLSNYICMIFMFIVLVKTIKKANKHEDGYCEVSPKFNFMCVILISVTFFVYNLLLANEHTIVSYFTSMSNMIMHVILPIMFVLNWVLFYKHSSIKWYYPLLCIIMPLIYVVFIIIRALIIGNGTGQTLYPYFFLNIDKLGLLGFLGWLAILLVAFVALGYILYLLDNIKIIKEKLKKHKSSK